MTINTTPDDNATAWRDRYTAHQHLHHVWVNLLDARIGADSAVELLSGSRAARAAELVDKISDAIAHVARLRVVVEGDERAEQAAAVLR